MHGNNGTSAVGIDIGSRMTKIVRVSGNGITDSEIFETGHDPLDLIQKTASSFGDEAVVATGYGRRLVRAHLPCSVVTEIRACARGARYIDPDCVAVIDIGGQDSKAIELKGDGGFGRFEMNDRCAAGTGRFLEVMAGTLGYTIDTFGSEALLADSPATINSMCTVFAESEIISMLARGEDRRRIALSLHVAVARRVAAMASRLYSSGRALFVGGVANNPCIGASLIEELGNGIIVPERPELTVALGAALIGLDNGHPDD